MLTDYCPISADHSHFLACLAEPVLTNTAQVRGSTPRGERQLAGLCVTRAQAADEAELTQPSPPLWATDPGREGADCVSAMGSLGKGV